ncbi:MAG TPA: lytic transglycosylase domain-containing protein, partial [Acholeplasmataceae bacterium]|nr:lytic transglycosylase domain-containing protein [Acholeplasmataceae bacterium]
MKKILIVLAILFLAAQISICAKQQNAKINMLTSDEESSNIVLVSCNTKETQELRDEIIDIKKQEKSEEVMPNYDVPLDKEIQQYLYSKCKEYEIEYELALAIIQVESNFKPNAVNVNSNNTKDVGLFQINSFNHKWLSEELGITDFADPYQNIDAGIFM